MKKIAVLLFVTCLSLTFLPLQAMDGSSKNPSSLVVTKPPEPVESTEATALLKRLEEIKAMDKSKMNSSEKKDLRVEVRATKHHLHEIGGGVYISVGGILLIALLLIILL